jgi:hypothetical protein
MDSNEYRSFIEARKAEICADIEAATEAALYTVFADRRDSKALIPSPDGKSFLINFKEGIGFRVTVELDHEPNYTER